MPDQNDHPVNLLPELSRGDLEADEAARLREHLSGCESCSAAFRELVDAAGAPASPGEGEDDALGDQGEGEPRRRSAGAIAGWVAMIAAILALTLVVGGFVGYAFRDANPTGTEKDTGRQGDLVQAFAQGTVAVSETQNGAVSIKLLRVPGKSDTFAWVNGLPSLPAGKAYQAWFSTDGATFEPSNTFTTDHGGAWLSAKDNIDKYTQLTFTIEDESGARQPSQPPFALVNLRKATMTPVVAIALD